MIEEQETITADSSLYRVRNMNISTLNHTFNNFKVYAETRMAYDVLKSLSEKGDESKGVALYGKTGSGKTHLIEAAVIAWNSRGMQTKYYTFSEIARSLKRALRVGNYDSLFEAYCNTERLIIDDIGMGTTESRFEIADLEDIIDTRYRHRYYPDKKLVTIIATNQDLPELPERIISRFREPDFGVVIYMGSKDYRRELAKNEQGH